MGYKLIRAVQASPVARCLASALLLVKHLGPAGPGAAPCEGWTLPQRHFLGQMQQGDIQVLQMSATCVMLLLRVDMLVLADRPSKSTGSQQGLEGNKQTF